MFSKIKTKLTSSSMVLREAQTTTCQLLTDLEHAACIHPTGTATQMTDNLS